jgi:copper(I)-binding protein
VHAHSTIHRTTSTTSTTTRTLRTLGLGATALVLTAALAACGEQSSPDPAAAAASPTSAVTSTVVVGDPWVRATNGSEDPSMTGAFMTLDNPGTEPVTLVSASSSVARTTELHEMAMVDGAMSMQAVDDGIVLEAGRGKVLEPGGFHVMLMGLRDALAPGDEVDLSLVFSDGSTQDLVVPVKAFTEEEGHYHAPGTGDHDH